MSLLILGGTGEGNELARALAGRDVVNSLAGRTGHLPQVPGRMRMGGFGGVAGLVDYLRTEDISAIIDATHPFAARMAAHAAEACAIVGIPRLKLLRPEWARTPGDRWTEADNMAQAVDILPNLGRRAFLTIGIQELAHFVSLPDMSFLVRLLSPAPLPASCHAIIGRPPFCEADEVAAMRGHGIEALVTKHSGGNSTYAKIAAARALGLPVLMIRRPPPPPGPVVTSVAEAVAWAATHLGDPSPFVLPPPS